MPAFAFTKLVTVGTTVTTLLNPKDKRTQWLIIFPGSGKIAANTGNVYINVDVPPVATAGASGSGHLMQGGDTWGEVDFQNLGLGVSKGTIYAIASTSGQIVEVYETTRP